MRTRPLLRVLLLICPLWVGLGCHMFGQKKKTSTGPPPRPITLPPPVQPTSATMRSQKPESPQVVALPPPSAADGEVAVRVVAYVNNMPIFDSEVREGLVFHLRELSELSDSEREAKLKEYRSAELDKLIDREVVLDVAYARLKKMPGKVLEDLQHEGAKEFEHKVKEIKESFKLASDDQLKDFLQKQGMSLTNFRRSVERNFISTEYMRNMIFPKLQFIPLSEVREYYDRHPDEFTEKDRAKWQDIYIDASKFPARGAARSYAAQVTAHLRGGGDFAAAAKQLQQAGYNILLSEVGIGERPGEIKPPELESAVFALKAGQVGGPVELGGGFHIVKVTERSQAGRKPLTAELQNEIHSRLQNMLAAKEYRRMLDEMKSRALIQRLE